MVGSLLKGVNCLGFDTEMGRVLSNSHLLNLMPVTKEKFTEICKEHNYPDDIIEHLWRTRPSGELSEKAIRKITEETAPQILDLVRFIEEIMEMGIEGG